MSELNVFNYAILRTRNYILSYTGAYNLF